MAKAAVKKKPSVWDDPLAIPAFLRGPRVAQSTPGQPGAVLRANDVPWQVPLACRAAYRALEPLLREHLTALVRRGHFRWDWLAQASTVAHFARQLEERDEKRQEAAQQLTRRGGQLAGLVPLAKLLDGLGKPVETRHAKAALEQAQVPHIKWHVELADVEHARRVISEFEPTPEPEGGGKFRGPAVPQHDPALVVGWVKGKQNPKRPGSGAHARWELVKQHSGRSVGAFLAAGGNAETLHNAVKTGCVTLEKRDEANKANTDAGRKSVDAKQRKSVRSFLKTGGSVQLLRAAVRAGLVQLADEQKPKRQKERKK
jgi:hypothetical protein